MPLFTSCVSEEMVSKRRIAIPVEAVRVDVPVVRHVDERQRAVTGSVVLWQVCELVFLSQMASQFAQQRGANTAQQGSKRTGLCARAITWGWRRGGDCKQQQCCYLQANEDRLRCRMIASCRAPLVPDSTTWSMIGKVLPLQAMKVYERVEVQSTHS
jgi:hypothetical protein